MSASVVVVGAAAAAVFLVLRRKQSGEHQGNGEGCELEREESTVFTNMETSVTADDVSIDFGMGLHDFQTAFNPDTAMFNGDTYNFGTVANDFGDFMEEGMNV